MGVGVPARGRLTARAVRRGAALLIALGVLAVAGAWGVGRFAWVLDLATPFTAHAAAVGAAGAVAAWLGRVRSAAIVLALAAVVGWWGLARGRDLLPPGDAPPGPTLSVLVYNAYAQNPDHAGVERVVRAADADVVVLIEPEVELSRAIRRGEVLADLYPSWTLRGWVPNRVSPILVLTRLPAAAPEPAGDDPAAQLTVVVESAFGEVGIVAGQPLSPRAPGRWREGAHQVGVHLEQIARLRARGVPVVLAADLNSAPAGSRGRTLARAGMRACKPLLAPAGTFPAWLPWPLRLSIDDAWRSPELRVVRWEPAGAGGSDHGAVLVELAPAR